jgi:hypothetical protein
MGPNLFYRGNMVLDHLYPDQYFLSFELMYSATLIR